jgi:hypothetical protein
MMEKQRCTGYVKLNEIQPNVEDNIFNAVS